MNESPSGFEKPDSGSIGSDWGQTPPWARQTESRMTRLVSVGQGGRSTGPPTPRSTNGISDQPTIASLLSLPPNVRSVPLESRKRKLSTEDVVILRRKVSENRALRLKRFENRFAETLLRLYYYENNGVPSDYSHWRTHLPITQLVPFFRANKLNPTAENEDLLSCLVAAQPTVLTSQGGDRKFGSPMRNIKSSFMRSSTPIRPNSSSSTPETPSNSQEQIVERAKQEAHVMQRIGELQRDGLWAEKRLPKVHEPSRTKAHWDYLLEEMVWLAADFAQERKWKKAAAKKCARMVQRYFQEKENLAQKAVKAQELQLKRIASFMAREVKQFWSNVEKLVEYKQTTRLEEKRKKALDQHLSFIVDQTEKYSSLVAESMNTTSAPSSRPTSPPPVESKGEDDVEFQPEGSSDDDEETIAKEEDIAKNEQDAINAEIDALKRESELPLEELLADYLNKRDELPEEGSPASLQDDVEDESKGDTDFRASDKDSDDDEETIQKEEESEGKNAKDYQQEIDELKAENEMSIDQLMAKYQEGVKETTQDEGVESEMEIDSNEAEGDDEEDDTEEEEDEDEDKDSESGPEEDEEEEGAALKALFSEQGTQGSGDSEQEFNDAAAIAESIQPKGNTLSSTSVVTKVPFLLKHKLREYQHIGLDWLVTMFERRLNGILADEMGLGKTIQTIALLAHLACEKGNWGPHLIVVPTSVILNWEMEFKKWCPGFKILTYYGSQKERKLKRHGWTKPNTFHVCITSYKLIIQDHQSFRRKKWMFLILDEAQNIKNFKSQRWQLLLNFQTQRRLLLTGTPLQNNLMELWSLMHFLMPSIFESHKEFKEWFSNPVTGMIEGNSEYNETIIKRLHKVLRPFLLRRLKSEVETQMPKKYEHVVMCRLSKRQRYLYDDFMSRAKTKETLASGNFLSVINVLMQLRKVCNHPNLFEVRPTVSPFQMEQLCIVTASLVVNMLNYDPLAQIDLLALNLKLVELELCCLAFVSHRAKRFQTPARLIEEIDTAPPPPPKCPKGKITIHVKRNTNPSPILSQVRPMLQLTGTNHRVVGGGIQAPTVKVGTSPVMRTILTQGGQGVTLKLAQSQLPGGYLQLVPQQGAVKGNLVTMGGNVLKTDGGQVVTTMSQQVTRLVPQLAQVVNTPSGKQILLSPQQVLAAQTTGTTMVMTTGGQRLTVVSKPTVARLVTSPMSSTIRPLVNKVPPLNLTSPIILTASQAGQTPTSSANPTPELSSSKPATPSVTSVTTSVVTPSSTPTITPATTPTPTPSATPTPTPISSPAPPAGGAVPSLITAAPEARRKLYDAEVEAILKRRRKETLKLIARLNERRCQCLPIYGSDLVSSLTMPERCALRKENWRWTGRVHCLTAKSGDPRHYWESLSYLDETILTIEQRVESLKDILARFVLYVPAVSAPRPTLHCSHPAPWKLESAKQRDAMLEKAFLPVARLFHPVASAMTTQFPDPRLIQYDCGKLQALDKLLRHLKTGHHRALIFTQMTRMLDVLEAFLNFHGHIYLRLDGTTKVEQRQMLMDRFNNDRRIFCFILSTRSGGVGVNLTGADTVIFYDSDWNPTMDAQAQDRCHRIGQTQDVHIYRLISEKTVEENILKKANQKRMLGDVAIEGGNFTTAYFKSSTIKDIFNVDVNENDAAQRMAEVLNREKDTQSDKEVSEKGALGVLETALAEAEDETDVAATKVARDEADAELAEFDENIPLDQESAEPAVSKAEQELKSLMQQLSGVERYAMKFIEETESAWSAEQLAAAEAEIEQQKREWELGRLASLKEEEEERKRKAETELDELLTYSATDARNQVWVSASTKEVMPMWCPPTPPQDDSDVYIDHALGLLYELSTMTEVQLPPVYVKKDRKRIRLDPALIEARSQVKMRPAVVTREEGFLHSAPRSLFDRPTPALIKLRQEMRLQRFRGGLIRPSSIVPGLKTHQLTPVKPHPEPEHVPEWIIQEDWAILQAVQHVQQMMLSLTVLNPGQTPNWDLVADMVNMVSRTYRSPKQCRNRFESVILPREEGKLVIESPKKQKKTKTLYKPPPMKCGRPMRTAQLYQQDNNLSMTRVMNSRFDAIRSVSNRRSPTVKPLLVDPGIKNPKHAEVLADFAIDYDNPLNPIEVASRRADRIAKEKQAQQQAQQQALAAAATASEQQQMVLRLQQGQTASGSAVGVVTSAATAAQVVKAGQSSAGSSPSTPSATARQVATVTVQDVAGASRTVTASPARATAVAVKTPPPVAAGSKPATLSSINVATLQKYASQPFLKQHRMKVLQARQGQVTPVATVASITPSQKVPVATVAAPAGSPTTVQRVQQVKQGVPRQMTESEMVALLKRQHVAKNSVAGAQIISAPVTSGVPSGQVATVVKTVASTGLPVAGLTLPQVKAALSGSGAVTQQQLRQLSIQQQIIAQRKLPQHKVTHVGKAGPSGAQLIVQSQKALPTTMTMQQIQQVMKQVQPQQVVGVMTGRPQTVSLQQTSSGSVQVASGEGTTSPITQHLRVIPVAAANSHSNKQTLANIKQAIQMVTSSGAMAGRVSGVQTVSVPSAAAGQPALLTQAVLQSGAAGPITVRQPVRIQTSSPQVVAVAVSHPQATSILNPQPQPQQDQNQQ